MGFESVDNMVLRAQSNALENGITNTTFVHADLANDNALAVCHDFRPAKVLLDPSRDGTCALIPQLAQCGASRIVYVSCNPQVLPEMRGCWFARDTHLKKSV